MCDSLSLGLLACVAMAVAAQQGRARDLHLGLPTEAHGPHRVGLCHLALQQKMANADIPRVVLF